MVSKLLLSQEDYNSYKKLLKEKQKKLDQLNGSRSESYTAESGKGRMSDSYMSLEAQANSIKADISSVKAILAKAKIVERKDLGEDVVDLGDKVSIVYEGEDEPETYKVVGRYNNDDEDENVSINAPLGKAIYLQKVGTVCNFSVDGREITVKIVANESAMTREPGDE